MARKKHSLFGLERNTSRRQKNGGPRSSLTRLEDQVAAVGGRKRPAPSGDLQKMEDDLLGRSPGPVSVAQSYDAGLPIELRYRPSRDTHVPETFPASPWDAGQALSVALPYTVEPFEEPPAPPAVPAPDCPPAPAAPVQEAVSPGPAGTLPGAAPSREAEAVVPPDTAQISALGAQIDDFEADIRAVLAQGGMTGPELPAPESPTAGEPPAPGAPAEDTHAIFDQLGRNMQYANTFNLGAIELDQRFDAFERELDREMAAPEPPKTGWMPGAPSDLDDLDVLADVVQIGEQAPKKKPEPDQGSVLAGGGSENETPSAGPALRTGSDEAVEDAAKQGRLAATGGAPPSTGPALPAGSDEATEDRTEQGRLAATGELLPESAPPAAEEKPSLGVRTPKDEFEASRQGTLIENQQHA